MELKKTFCLEPNIAMIWWLIDTNNLKEKSKYGCGYSFVTKIWFDFLNFMFRLHKNKKKGIIKKFQFWEICLTFTGLASFIKAHVQRYLCVTLSCWRTSASKTLTISLIYSNLDLTGLLTVTSFSWTEKNGNNQK